MKVFEVIVEYCRGDDNELIREVHYATSDDSQLQTVALHFANYCFEYDKDLKSVREMLTLTRQIKSDGDEK